LDGTDFTFRASVVCLGAEREEREALRVIEGAAPHVPHEESERRGGEDDAYEEQEDHHVHALSLCLSRNTVNAMVPSELAGMRSAASQGFITPAMQSATAKAL
jgi:hypothetical protein